MKNAEYTNIISRFKSVFNRYFIIGIAEAFGYTFFVFTGLIVIFAVCESLLYMTPVVKTVLFFSSLIVPAVVFISFTSLHILRSPGNDEISRMIEHSFPHLNDRLISAVQLGRLSEDELEGQSKELIDALLKKVDKETAPLDLTRSVPVERFLLSTKMALGSLVLILLLTLIFPDYLMGGIYRLADFSRQYMPPNKSVIYTIHREHSIIRGENFNVSGFYSGDRSEELALFFRWIDSKIWNMKPVSIDKTRGKFSVNIEKPGISFQYYLETKSAVTTKYDVTVIERPAVEALEIALHYPEYTGLGTVTRKDNDGNIRALKGAVASFSVRANKILSGMSIFRSDSTVKQCSISGDTGSASFSITKSFDYHIGLIDTMGITNINPITYRVTSLQDEFPTVTIVSPISDIILPNSMKFPIIYRALDDYGLSSVALKFKLPFEDEFRYVSLQKGSAPDEEFGKQIEGEYLWNLSGLNLLPDDSFSFNLVVYDNDTIEGPKMGVSEARNISLPSLTDIFKDVMKEQNEDIDKLREISERTSLQDEKLDDIRRNIKSSKELEWSDKNALEEAQKHLERMQKDVRNISENVKNIAERLSEENIVALETLEKLQKISEIMDDIAEGEMKEALKLLTMANLELDPRNVKEALDRYKITSEDIKNKLDRIINLLEQAKSLQRYEMAKNLLEDMAIKQAEMTVKYRQNPNNSELVREEKKLATEMEKIQDELQGALQDLKDKFRLNTKALDESIESNNVAEVKNKAADQMSEGLTGEAENSLDKSNTMISELLLEMDEFSAMMQASNTEEIKRRLFKALNEMLVVSGMQERLNREVKTFDNEELARKQLDIVDALSKSEKSLSGLGEIVIDLSGVIDQIMTSTRMLMDNTVERFAAGDIPAGEKDAWESLKTLNSSIHFLTMLIQKSQGNQGMPGDLMQQLQNIANGQLSIQQLLNSEMLAQLAAEQQKLAEMLSELSNKILEDKRLQEMLGKLTEEMDDTADMMRRNEKRELIERKQLDIYRRLLDAKRSRREKDDSEERKSWTAKKNISLGADKLADDLGEKEHDLNERIEQAMKDDFDPEYINLIRRYFESLLQYKLEMEQ